MAVDYKAWLAMARAELQDLQQQKAEIDARKVEIDRRVAALIKTIAAIAPIVEEPVEAPGTLATAITVMALSLQADATGMTDKVRAVLKVAGEPLTATQVRDQLQVVGFDLSAYSNALATIHTVLNRLGESGEAKRTVIVGPKGTQSRKVYQWISASGDHRLIKR